MPDSTKHKLGMHDCQLDAVMSRWLALSEYLFKTSAILGLSGHTTSLIDPFQISYLQDSSDYLNLPPTNYPY